MKTTVVPAQVTTVEDRLIGNLTFAQILIFIIPLFTDLVTYLTVVPRSQLDYDKTILIVSQSFIICLLALRVNEKILANWLWIFFKFICRPKIYLYSIIDPAAALSDKNISSENAEEVDHLPTLPDPGKTDIEANNVIDHLVVEKMIRDRLFNVRIQPRKSGGYNVFLKSGSQKSG